MSNNSGKGSLVLKLAIFILSIALILVIKIPASIWSKEKIEKEKAQFNMSSIYEVEKQYHRLTGKYTTNQDTLLEKIKEDSSIVKINQLVQHTQQLRRVLNGYLNIDLVNSLMIIDENITTIMQDLETNERYFRIDENIKNEAEQLRINLSTFSNDVRFPNYSSCVTYIDSLSQLKRDLSDYNLQTAASMTVKYSQQSNSYLPNVEIDGITKEWQEISKRLENFRRTTNEPLISQHTSVSARLKEFISKINAKFNSLPLLNIKQNIDMALTANKNFNDIYKEFLKDFLVTSKRAQYRLSLEDSMILYISKDNFYSPVSHDPYKLNINSDSSDVKVESPLLLENLRAMVKSDADKIAGFDFVKYYFEYADTVQSIINKGIAIKSQMRRNLDITIKNAELKDNLSTYQKGSEYKAATELEKFVDIVSKSQSYSELKDAIESARNAVGIFQQVYGGNLFVNIDSVNQDIISNLNAYNKILSEIKRLPKGIKNFESEPEKLNHIVDKIKQKTTSNSTEELAKVKSQFEDALQFATEGETQRVYLIFKKEIKNFGYVYKNSKSWEEEKDKNK